MFSLSSASCRRGLFAFVACLACVGALATTAQAAPANVAVVNKKMLMNEVKAIKAFQATLQKTEKDLKSFITSQSRDIETQAQKLLAAKDNYSKEDLQKRVKSLSVRQAEIQKNSQALAASIEKALLPALQQVKKAIDGAVAKVAKAKKIDIVVDEVSAAYFSPAADITKDVVAEIDSSLKEVKISLPKIPAGKPAAK